VFGGIKVDGIAEDREVARQRRIRRARRTPAQARDRDRRDYSDDHHNDDQLNQAEAAAAAWSAVATTATSDIVCAIGWHVRTSWFSSSTSVATARAQLRRRITQIVN
jgi:hypothetical protein